MIKQPFIEYKELYDAWINSEHESMKICGFPEEKVNLNNRKTDPDYQNNIILYGTDL